MAKVEVEWPPSRAQGGTSEEEDCAHEGRVELPLPSQGSRCSGSQGSRVEDESHGPRVDGGSHGFLQLCLEMKMSGVVAVTGEGGAPGSAARWSRPTPLLFYFPLK